MEQLTLHEYLDDIVLYVFQGFKEKVMQATHIAAGSYKKENVFYVGFDYSIIHEFIYKRVARCAHDEVHERIWKMMIIKFL